MEYESSGAVDVVLRSAGVRPIGVYNIVRRLTDLNAKDAKKLVDSAPVRILASMARVQAEALKVELEALGALVELKPADLG